VCTGSLDAAHSPRGLLLQDYTGTRKLDRLMR
jgi:hypothetical protein